MCGICGFTGVKNDGLLKAMTASLAHRGPDEDGFFSDEDRVSLGMRRLKVIDLATGSQPIFNEDRTVAVVFNGEIYNFRELRAELEARGHRFATATDTEVLVHLYEERGEDFPKLLRGMFAFALWDSKTRKLLLARDQFGIKPLLYSVRGGRLYFASEIKALLAAGEIDTALDPSAVDAYFRNLCIPAPLTAYKSIRKLEPAGTLVFREGRATLGTYWSLPAFEGGKALRWEEYLERADALLASSVKEQLVSDVPLGLLLSGGLDSGSLLYYMDRAGASPVRTFNVGYGEKDPSYSELAGARLTAGRFGAAHTETLLEPDPRALMEKLAFYFDEPFADASAIPSYLVTSEARKQVTVALTGIGGDEFFGGYPRHLGARFLTAYQLLPGAVRGAAASAARFIPESYTASNAAGRLKRFFTGGRGGFRGAYEDWTSYFNRTERERLLSPARSAAAGTAPPLPGRLETPDDIFAYELRNYLSDDLLRLADTVSMANSLELRVPFLDVRLAELMASAPLSLKTRGFTLKAMIKALMADRLPPEVLRGPKRGFQVPLARWYSEDLKGFAREVLGAGSLEREGWLSPGYAAEMLKEHESGRRNLNDQIHAAVMFELWLARNRRLSAVPASSAIRVGAAPLNVLFCADIIQQDDAGGSGRVAWETARRLAAIGHRPTVLTKGAPGKPDHERAEGVEIYRYRGNPLKLFSCVREISRRGRVDVMEFHHPYTSALARLALRDVPAVYNFHSPWGEEYGMRSRDKGAGPLVSFLGGAVRKQVERRVLKSSSLILNASRYMHDKLLQTHGQESRIVPLGVDLDEFRPAADRALPRESLGVAADRFLVLTVRNLVGRMGLENLVEAAAAVVKAEPRALFIIGGSGYLRGKLAEQIKQRGLSENVRLEGFIPDAALVDYYQAADLFVLSTTALEGFGLVTLEALACGTPVLATPVAATPEILTALAPAMLLRDASPRGIAEGVLEFIPRYAVEKDAIRLACRAFVEKNYSWEKYAAEVELALIEAAAGAK